MLLLIPGCAGQPQPSRVPRPAGRHFNYAVPKQANFIESGEIDQLKYRFAGARSVRTLTGKATYYGDSLAGNRMASGERYDPQRAQAAHRTLPFGTIVRVTRIATNESVIVRIADRGPFGGKGRIIDISHAAAERLGMLRSGVADVRVEVLELP
jgi:rare lipoprotein A